MSTLNDQARLQWEPTNLMTPLSSLYSSIYYYTRYYGLSVAQKTGKGQKYWLEDLPKMLRKAASLEDIGRIIGDIDNLRSKSKDRQKVIREKKRHKVQLEAYINAQLELFLQALNPETRHTFFSLVFSLHPHNDLIQGYENELRYENGKPSNNHDFVEPDLVFANQEHLFLIEIKTGAKYDASQLAKYAKFVVASQYLENTLRIPRRKMSDNESVPFPHSFSYFQHLIVLPDYKKKHFDKPQDWIESMPSSFGDRFQFSIDAVLKSLKSTNAPFTKDRMIEALGKLDVKVASWKDLGEHFSNALQTHYGKDLNTHWTSIQDQFFEMCRNASPGVDIEFEGK